MNRIFFLLLLLPVCSGAQQTETLLDYWLKPATTAPRYGAIITKEDTLWHRKVYYLPERSMAIDAWYLDTGASVPHGPYVRYYANRNLQQKGTYRYGKQHGVWLRYHENGMMADSANFVEGRRKGSSIGWYPDGMPSDSTNFDGNGNGVEVNWYEDGKVQSAGMYVSDTLKKGRWKYYHRNGQLKATEDYEAGNRTTCACFNEQGQPLDTARCVERDAAFPGEELGWRKLVENGLRADVPVKRGAPAGMYQVLIQFIVETDGSLSGLEAKTKHGFGMEEEVLRLLRRSPRWKPAEQFGVKVRAYRIQPVTFVVEER